jgi:lipoprotein-releasing system permease protein
MNIRMILDISLHLLLARLKQTIVAGAGVTFGIAMFIALISFMTGLNDLLDGLILNRTPHVRLYNEVKASDEQPVERSARYAQDENFISSIKPKNGKKELRNVGAIVEALRNDSRVIDVAPKVNAPVFYNAGNIEIAGVINGIEVPAEEKLFNFSSYVIKGNISDLTNVNNSIFLGKGIADKMMVDVGDVIQLTNGKGQSSSLKVAGIVQLGLADLDNTFSFADISTTQQVLGEGTAYITDLQIKIYEMEMAPQLAEEYHRVFGVDAIDIQKANAQFETGSSVRSIISYAVGITLLIVAGFGIYNILNMMIYEKMDSIAILKATGFSGRDVKTIFIILSMIIGIAGGILGLLLGFGFSQLIDNLPFETEAMPTIKTFPVQYNPVYYVIGITFALITTYIAGWFPAQKASKVDPVVIIRGK